MICFWCSADYLGAPLYHVCPDGLTYGDRTKKTKEEVDEHNKKGCETSEDIAWTDYDLKMLKGMGIKP